MLPLLFSVDVPSLPASPCSQHEWRGRQQAEKRSCRSFPFTIMAIILYIIKDIYTVFSRLSNQTYLIILPFPPVLPSFPSSPSRGNFPIAGVPLGPRWPLLYNKKHGYRCINQKLSNDSCLLFVTVVSASLLFSSLYSRKQ